MFENEMTDAEVKTLPLEERVQIALHKVLGEDDSAAAWDAVEPLFAETARDRWHVARHVLVECLSHDLSLADALAVTDAAVAG